MSQLGEEIAESIRPSEFANVELAAADGDVLSVGQSELISWRRLVADVPANCKVDRFLYVVVFPVIGEAG